MPRLSAAARSLAAAALIVLLCFLAYGQSAAVCPDRRVVVIDAGHGGIDGGTNRGALLEKDITLKTAQKLKAVLEREGCSVIMTRNADVSLDGLNRSSSSRHKRDLNARVGISNGSGADLFISIHVNSLAGDSSEKRLHRLYGSRFPQSEILAHEIQNALNVIAADDCANSTGPCAPDFFSCVFPKSPALSLKRALYRIKKTGSC
jgi:N-acetylmuramoyl-L-alanine amidase